MSILHIDFETRSTIDLPAQGADLYARHGSTDIHCLGFKFDDEPTHLITKRDPLPARVEEHVKSGGLVVAHNANFEWLIWNHVCVWKYDWPVLTLRQLECTKCQAFAMALPSSLEKAAAAMGIHQQKDMKGYRVMMKLSAPKEILSDGTIIWYEPETHPELFDQLYQYCCQDVLVEHELYQRLQRLSPSEKRVWELDQIINERGVMVDIKAAKAAIQIVEMEQERLNERMRKITGNQVATCTAVKQLTDWIKAQGYDIKGVAKADILDLLSQPLKPSVREALLIRQEAAKSSTAKLTAMLNRADHRGRVRGIFQYHGAGTGRWAGRGIQPQNFPRPNLGAEEIESVFEILESVE